MWRLHRGINGFKFLLKAVIKNASQVHLAITQMMLIQRKTRAIGPVCIKKDLIYIFLNLDAIALRFTPVLVKLCDLFLSQPVHHFFCFLFLLCAGAFLRRFETVVRLFETARLRPFPPFNCSFEHLTVKRSLKRPFHVSFEVEVFVVVCVAISKY